VKPLQPGDPQRVGRYQLLGRLGAGGMGQVFLGQSPGGRLVAVKLIRAELAADREFRARFAREVAAARHVSGMFTAAVVDADPDAPQPWLVTAYVPGPSLAEAVDGQGPLPLTSVLTLAAGLAEGLGAIHAEGMVHRDLKPSNVLLASDGPRIIDFGISRAVDATALTRADFVVGSPGFMSPEQALGRDVGPPSDIFSLGAVLAFAAAGVGPFGGGTATAMLYRVVHDRPAIGKLPGRIRPLVDRCLAKDPRSRPTTEQLLAELATVDSADSGVDWLPQPVAETLQGYAEPVASTAVEPTVPPAPVPVPDTHPSPTQASGEAPPAQTPAAAAASAQSSPAAAASAPPSPAEAASAQSSPAGAASARASVAEAPPGWAPAFEAPPANLADGRRGADITAPLPRHPGTARPRRRLSKVAVAAAVVVVLAVAGAAALALTSRGHTGAPVTPPASSPAFPRPKTVVEEYFAAINSHNWRKVWELGGKNFSQTYRAMIAGYRGTAHDVVTGIVAHGDTVSLRLAAHQANGTVQTYQASYKVHDGVITKGRVTQVTG
jgi:eukaryotic-like serine/threonine-protein kinase